jgi:hypothetical protein
MYRCHKTRLRSPRACRYTSAIAAHLPSPCGWHHHTPPQPQLLLDTLLPNCCCAPLSRANHNVPMPLDAAAFTSCRQVCQCHCCNYQVLGAASQHKTPTPTAAEQPPPPKTTTADASPQTTQLPLDAPAVTSCLQVCQCHCCVCHVFWAGILA